MRNVFVAVVAFVAMAGFSSCQKTCTRQITKPDGTQVMEEYNCQPANNGNGGCATCGGGDYTAYQPGTGNYTPENFQVSVTGYIINAPGDIYGTDFADRKENNAAYAVVLFDKDGWVVAGGIAGGAVESNYMAIWAYFPGYGATLVAVSRNQMGLTSDWYVGSSITANISLDITRPFAKLMNPSTAHLHTQINAYTGTPIYARM